MRQFFLQNEAGQRIGLNGENGIRLGDPAGLGVSFSGKYSDLGGGFFRQEERKTKQQSVTCSLTFLRPAYSRYRQFINWLAAAKELYLIYKPFGDLEYFRRCELDYLTKTELGHGKWLETPCALKCLTPWYIAEPTELALVKATGTVKRYGWDEAAQDYGYRYTEDLRYGGETEGQMSAQIAPSGHEPAGIVLRYRGAITNPTIRLVGQTSGTVYGVCALSSERDAAASFGATDVLELSTRRDDCHIWKIAADGQKTDLVAALDLNFEPYFTVPTTEYALLSVESASAFSGSASLQVYYYYWSV